MAGLTPAGFLAKTLNEIIADIGLALQQSSSFGPGVNLDEDGPIGQMIGAVAIPLAEVWQVQQQGYDSRDPDQAEGTQLDNLTALNGVRREGETASTAKLTLSGDPFVIVSAGSIVRIPNGERFILDDDTTFDAAGDATDVDSTAETTGPITGAPGAITEIVTQVAGWLTVTNPADIVPGQDRETDNELRVRREQSLQIVGAGPDQAIRARLEALDDVDAAVVISNRTLLVDAFGIPGKSFRAVLYPPTADKEGIALAIFATQPAGIFSDGTEAVVITDDQSYAQTVRFSFATTFDLFLDAILTVDGNYPVDGDVQVNNLLAVFYNELSVGDDVVLIDGICAVKAGATGELAGVPVTLPGVPGILTFELRAKFGSAPGAPDVVNLAVALDEISLTTQDPGRITVSS